MPEEIVAEGGTAEAEQAVVEDRSDDEIEEDNSKKLVILNSENRP